MVELPEQIKTLYYTIAYKIAYYIDLVASGDITAIIIVVLMCVGMITSTLILERMFAGKDTRTFTPLFWFVANFVTLGISGMMFILVEFYQKRKKRMCDINYYNTYFLVVLVSFVAFVVMNQMTDDGNFLYEDTVGFTILIGFSVAITKLVFDSFLGFSGDIYVANDIEAREKKFLMAASLDRKMRKKIERTKGVCAICVKDFTGDIEDEDDEVTFTVLPISFIKESRLVSERQINAFTLKVYEHLGEQIEVIELRSLFYRDILAATAAIFTVFALCTPYYIWLLNSLIAIIENV